MATLKKIRTHKNWNTRPESDNVIIAGHIYKGVEKGEPYDLVQFSINEITGYFWNESICVPLNTSDDDIKKIVEEYVATITDDDIKDYQRFLDDGNKYGWD